MSTGESGLQLYSTELWVRQKWRDLPAAVRSAAWVAGANNREWLVVACAGEPSLFVFRCEPGAGAPGQRAAGDTRPAARFACAEDTGAPVRQVVACRSRVVVLFEDSAEFALYAVHDSGAGFAAGAGEPFLRAIGVGRAPLGDSHEAAPSPTLVAAAFAPDAADGSTTLALLDADGRVHFVPVACRPE